MALRRIQEVLAALYDVQVEPSVDDFVCDREVVRSVVGAEDARGEVLLVADEPDGVSVGLYVNPDAVDVLQRALEESGDAWLEERAPFEAACLATEGVSHFLYLIFRAENDESVSQLELELQAEVDKYATGLMGHAPAAGPEALVGNGVGAIRARSRSLRHRLFARVEFIDAPGTERGDRYRVAHQVASRYVADLEARYVDAGDLTALRRELRRFYRRGLREKMEAARS